MTGSLAPMIPPLPTQKYHAIRQCGSHRSPAIFTSWEDLLFWLQFSSTDSAAASAAATITAGLRRSALVEYKSFDSMA
eukprot:CAMPEP_0194281568 /NCGR_PEP_ID=MMETSP0169-20130528/20994_1 /TAXON_ID=218684 /ORGANISM="Corethron pennatum, Strain L29A3" /LENGTH=77 /DNA_ID=CAMNT_0039026661 /DNA_START=142 /DNA_END=371 /DNA_ORIENTATION=+